MLRFCPVCSKNGIEAEINILQLNDHEAIFMCSSTKCTWPLGYQELTFINRSIWEDWSKHREKIAWENLPQVCPQVGGTIPNQFPVLPENNFCVFEEDSTTLSELDLSLDTIIHSELNLSSPPVDWEPINGKASVSPRNNGSNHSFKTVSTNLDNVKLTVNSVSTSLNSNLVPVKTLSSNNLSRVSKVTKDSSPIKRNFGKSSKLLNRSRRKDTLFKKLNLNDLLKANSTNVNKETNVNSAAGNKESNREKENLNKTLNNGLTRVDFDSNSSWNKESIKEKENSKETNATSNNRENRPEFDSNWSFNNESNNLEANKNSESCFNFDEIVNGICDNLDDKPEAVSQVEFDWQDFDDGCLAF